MITCPECGQEAPDDARFCDRCGQGLSKSASAPSPPTRPTPLEAGATLKGGIEIVELTTQTSVENRYRAKRIRDGKPETIALRERFGPKPAADQIVEQPAPELPIAPTPIATEDPNGPRAKTAELRPVAAQPNGSANAAPSHPPIEFLEEPNAAPEHPKVIATLAATESATTADVQNLELPNEQPADGAAAESNGKNTTAGIAADATSSNLVADVAPEQAPPPTPQNSQIQTTSARSSVACWHSRKRLLIPRSCARPWIRQGDRVLPGVSGSTIDAGAARREAQRSRRSRTRYSYARRLDSSIVAASA